MSHDSTSLTLKQRFLGGVAWTGASRVVTNTLSLGVTVILARLLNPEDYGLMAMALVFTGLAQQAREMGVGQALIQRKESTRENQQTAFTMAFGASASLYILLFLLAGPIAWFYENPDVVMVLRVVALTFPISAFVVVPKAMLRRTLMVRYESMIAVVAMLLDASTTILLAWAGYGVWALVAGKLVSVLSQAIGLAFAFPWSPRIRFRGGDGRSIFRFGGSRTLSGLLWYAYSNADFLIIGRFLGSTALGAYTMAWNLAKMPWDRLWMVINPLVLPLFSRASEHPGELGRIFIRMSRYSALLIMPAVAGLGIVADDIVPLVLGNKWVEVIGPLRWLCAYGVARGVLVLLPSVLVATGKIRQEVTFNLLLILLLPPAFILGIQKGVEGPAIAWMLLYPGVAILWLLPRALRAAGVLKRQYLKAITRPMIATVCMVVLVAIAGELVDSPGWGRLVLKVIVGIGVYLVAVRLLEGSVWPSILSLLKDARRGSRG